MSSTTAPDNRPRPVISPLAFSREEYFERVAKARTAMAAEGVDGLLLTDDRNIFYFAGSGGATPREEKARPEFLWIPESGEVIILVAPSQCIHVRESSWIEDVRYYEDLSSKVVMDSLVGLIEEVTEGDCTIGMEIGYAQRLGMTVGDFEALKSRCSDHRFVDASDLLWGLRMVKSPAEVARIEQAVRITDQAYQRVLPTLCHGLAEQKIAARFHTEMARLGASTSWLTLQTKGYDQGGGHLKDREVQAGEMVWVDMGANVLGYWADFSRAAVLGTPTVHQLDMQQKASEITHLALEAVRPGVSMAEINGVCDREMEKRGLVFNTWGIRYGHGMGLQVTEPPHIAFYDETVVAPGMVLTLEPGMWTPEGRFQCEENFVVTDIGIRQLSETTRDLHVL